MINKKKKNAGLRRKALTPLITLTLELSAEIHDAGSEGGELATLISVRGSRRGLAHFLRLCRPLNKLG